MRVETLIPTAPLDQAIDVIWHCQAADFHCTDTTFPMLNQELVINLSDHFVTTTADQQVSTAGYTNWIMGMQTQRLYAEASGRHESMGVLFKPFGLFRLFGINALSLQNQVLSLPELFGKESRELLERLENGNRINAKVELPEGFYPKESETSADQYHFHPLFSLFKK
jgi:hypothetical protein